jgi:hypothetical protein
MLKPEQIRSAAPGRSTQTDRPTATEYRAFFTLPNVRWILILLLVSAFYTANVIQWSLRYSRLAGDPVADDVGYLIDGFERLNVLDTAGFHAFCNSLIQAPPHSPWSTALATLAFALMGVHDWAPYILNGFLVFLLLLVAWDLVEVGSVVSRAAIVSVILLLQLPFQAVHEFRPDFAVALFTAMFSLLLLKMACYGEQSNENHFYAGLLAGLAYLAKPTFFPHTTVILVAAVLLAEVSRRLVWHRRLNKSSEISATLYPGSDSPAAEKGPWRAKLPPSRGSPVIATTAERRSPGGRIMRLLATLAGAALVAGPYFLLSWRSVLDYFLANTGTGKYAALWKVPGGFWAALWSRLHGYDLDITLGPFSSVLALWSLLGFGFAVARRNRQVVCFTLSGLALAALSLVVISAGDMVDPHFSYTWIILFCLTTFYVVAEMVKDQRNRFLAGVFFLMSIFVFYKASPTKNISLVSKDTTRGHSMNEVIVRTIATRAASNYGGRPPVVLSTFMGKVNSISQTWLALTQNLNLVFRELAWSGDIKEQLNFGKSADFIEVADTDSQWLDRWLPSASLQSALLEKLRSSPDFHELPPVAGTEGRVFLFEKTERHTR